MRVRVYGCVGVRRRVRVWSYVGIAGDSEAKGYTRSRAKAMRCQAKLNFTHDEEKTTYHHPLASQLIARCRCRENGSVSGLES